MIFHSRSIAFKFGEDAFSLRLYYNGRSGARISLTYEDSTAKMTLGVERTGIRNVGNGQAELFALMGQSVPKSGNAYIKEELWSMTRVEENGTLTDQWQFAVTTTLSVPLRYVTLRCNLVMSDPISIQNATDLRRIYPNPIADKCSMPKDGASKLCGWSETGLKPGPPPSTTTNDIELNTLVPNK